MIIKEIIVDMMSDPAFPRPWTPWTISGPERGQAIHDRMTTLGADKWIKPLNDLIKTSTSLLDTREAEYQKLKENATPIQRYHQNRLVHYRPWSKRAEHVRKQEPKVQALYAAFWSREESACEVGCLKDAKEIAVWA